MSVTGVPAADPDTELVRERGQIVELLTQAYWMEIETVKNYIAASISDDGVGDLKLKAALVAGAEEEGRHAQRLGRRIHELHSAVARAGGLTIDHEYLQPLGRHRDIVTTLEAIVAAEMNAIQHYSRIRQAAGQIDEATSAMVGEILRDEQRRLRLFKAYQRQLGGAAA